MKCKLVENVLKICFKYGVEILKKRKKDIDILTIAFHASLLTNGQNIIARNCASDELWNQKLL
jgi:hypothetical protein